MKQYHDALQYILILGQDNEDRTGVGTRSVFGYQMRFNLSEGFPAITTKRLAWNAVVGELLWFLEGSIDERRLAELTYGKPREQLLDKSTIWTANADAQGVALGYTNSDQHKILGPVYGHQWRNFDGNIYNSQPRLKGTDQIKWLLNEIKTNPSSRRLILSAWNPNQLAEMALPPCHYTAIFRVVDSKLSCMLVMRSNDMFLGAPFNIASYALLTHILAREAQLGVGELVYSIADAHIYKNHIDQVEEQLNRTHYPQPTLHIDESFNLSDRLGSGFKISDASLFTLENYQYHPTIKAPMAV